MAEKKIIEIDVNTKDAVKAMENLSKATHDVSASFEEVYGDLQPLTTRMGEAEDRLYELANAGKTTTKEYKDLLKTVGDYRKVQIKTDMAVDAAATSMGQKLGGALNGVTSGFSAVQGIMGTFGAESKEVEEALLKVQSAMALQQGIQGVRESITSFKALGDTIKATSAFQKVLTAFQWLYNTALAANPVVAIVAGIAALLAIGYKLITMFQESSEANEEAAASTKRNTDELNKQVKANERVSEALKTKNGHEYNMAKASGASAEALRKLALKHADEEIALEKASLATARNTYEKEKNTLANYKNLGVSDEVIAKQRELVTESRKNVQEETKDLSDAYKNRQAIARANQVERKQEQTDAKKSAVDTQKETNDKIAANQKTAREKEAEAIKTYNESLTAYYSALEEQRIAQLTSEKDKEEAIVNAKYEKLYELADKAGESTKELQEKQGKELTDLNLKYAKIEQDKKDELKKTADEKAAADKALLQELTLSEDELKFAKLQSDYEKQQLLYKDNAEVLLALKKKYEEDVVALETAAAEKTTAQRRTVTEKQIEMTMAGLSIINDLFQMNAGKSEKDARRAFKVNKAYNLAAALTNTYLAVTAALATKVELFPGQRFLEAAAAGAAGAIQVGKISKTQFDGGGGGGGTPDTAVAPPPTATMSAPNFNVVGNSGINQLASLQQQPLQAYVVSGQITSQQSLDRNRKENATL